MHHMLCFSVSILTFFLSSQSKYGSTFLDSCNCCCDKRHLNSFFIHRCCINTFDSWHAYVQWSFGQAGMHWFSCAANGEPRGQRSCTLLPLIFGNAVYAQQPSGAGVISTICLCMQRILLLHLISCHKVKANFKFFTRQYTQTNIFFQFVRIANISRYQQIDLCCTPRVWNERHLQIAQQQAVHHAEWHAAEGMPLGLSKCLQMHGKAKWQSRHQYSWAGARSNHICQLYPSKTPSTWVAVWSQHQLHILWGGQQQTQTSPNAHW